MNGCYVAALTLGALLYFSVWGDLSVSVSSLSQ